MWPVQPSIAVLELLGEKDHVPVVRLSYEDHSFHILEVFGAGQSYAHSVTKIGAVSEPLGPI